MIVEAQATPRLAQKVIDKVRTVTDKPISHVVLTHYHAVRVPGASAFNASQVIMGATARVMGPSGVKRIEIANSNAFHGRFRSSKASPA